MLEEVWPKYHIGNGEIIVQSLKRTGYYKMPRPHAHPFYEVYYLLEGERLYFINGEVHTVQKGDIVVINPNDLHSTSNSDSKEFDSERLLIHISDSYMHNADAWMPHFFPFKKSGVVRPPQKDKAHIKYLVKHIIAECKEKKLDYQSSVRACVLQILVAIRRIDQLTQIQLQTQPVHHRISEITSYIHEHFLEPLTLGAVAKHFFISPFYLSRIFLKYTGFHFREYIQVVRIRKAELLLRDTNDKIQTIAGQVGFEHVAHFNRTFKKLTGLSPLRYRKQLR